MKRKVSSVRIEKAAQKNHHIVHTSYEPTESMMASTEKPHTFDSLDDTMGHVRGVLGGDEEIGEGIGPDPDDMKPDQKTKHSWHN